METISQCLNAQLRRQFLAGYDYEVVQLPGQKPCVSFYLLPRNLPRIISNNLLEAYSHLTDGTDIQKLIFQRFTCHLIMPTFYDTKR